MTLSGNDIRTRFLKYFQAQGHTVVKSSKLIPQNDPTLYFTNAGMVPFKNVFTGQEKTDFLRAASSQKCMRVSGKHNDLENVGRTARHHTFFEMLGNFSFGDYFKKEAIHFAWEFLTKEMGLPKEKLWITVFQDDDEAEKLWLKDQNIPRDRIKRMGEKDNFWSMGETGPCGPCSEIHYEQDIPCTLGNPNCVLGECDCDKYIEIWNLVFMQFNRGENGKMTILPKPSIDTGMGLERLAAVVQGKTSNYESDLFTPIIQSIEKIVQKKYGEISENDVSMRVLADHIRASVFLIGDGVLPSNEGRGYVLRRIMRRAIRHGKLLGQTHAFFYKLVKTVVSEMGVFFQDIKTNQKTIEKVIHAEEERFFETLDKGLKILYEEINVHKKDKAPILSGKTAFKLYDTFGFPLDLTEIIAEENNMTVDKEAFEKEMTGQKERARAGWKGSGENAINQIYLKLGEKTSTKFLGYDTFEATAKIIDLVQDGKEVSEVHEGEFEVIFDQTPFYAESGGQVGDQGIMTSNGFEAVILDTQKPVPNLFVHSAKVKAGSLNKNGKVQLAVFHDIRKATTRNHTATHIMHAVLRRLLGSHVRQAGSLVNDKMLRFDFSHFEAISQNVLQRIEDEVNAIILKDLSVSQLEMSYDKAIQKGALAFFGDKYDSRVRVISVGEESVELCGGTHINRSSEIGFFKILSESSIAAGVRRIEATTGRTAMKLAQEESILLHDISSRLKTSTSDLGEKIEKLQNQIKSQQKEIEKLKSDLLRGGSVDYLKGAFQVNGVMAVVYHTKDIESIRDIADALMDKLKSGVSVVAATSENKIILVVSVSQDLLNKFQANQLLSHLAKLVDARGGGNADRAQAGGKNPSGLSMIETKLKELLS